MAKKMTTDNLISGLYSTGTVGDALAKLELELEVAKCAADLLSDKDKWVYGQYAQAASGYATPPNSEYAVKWCAVGAEQKCCGDRAGRIEEVGMSVNRMDEDLVTMLDRTSNALYSEDIVTVNDDMRTEGSYNLVPPGTRYRMVQRVYRVLITDLGKAVEAMREATK